jgi:hypothetical protein
MAKTERAPFATILPPPPVIKPLRPPRIIAPPLRASPKVTPRPMCAQGGDLLYFEGLPFRYLEHIEELPPFLRPVRTPHYKETLHDMINSIVSMDTSWTEQQNVCSV